MNRIIPHLYSEPSLPRTVCISTPYISRFFALFKNESSAWAGVWPLRGRKWWESDEKVMRKWWERKWWERKWWERKWWERKLRLGRRLTPVWKKVMRGPWLHNQGFFSQRHKSLLSLDRMLHLWIGWDDALGINKSQSHRLMVMVSHHPHHNHYHHCHRGPKSSTDNQSSLASAARATISRPSGQVAQNCAAPDDKGFVNFSFSLVLR